MEKTSSTDIAVPVIEKPSIFQKIKAKLSSINKMTGIKTSANDKKDISFFDKNKYIFFIALAVISTFLIVSTIYKSIAASPIPKINSVEAQTIMSSLYSTEWIYDESEESLSPSFTNKVYKKIDFSNKIDSSGNKLAVKLFEEDNDLGLGMDLGYLYYSSFTRNLTLILPDAQELKFLYTKSGANDIENLSLINDKNNRIYFTKKEYTKIGEPNV
ncbi:MAG: hypothetical protein JJE21_01390 [Spirochaetaceae bacterium]|nr:hypothetical protein [Spirochaetaceae bacterium]